MIILIIHIMLAAAGLTVSAVAVSRPSRYIRPAKLLVALTILSGLMLGLQTHASLSRLCWAGLIYLLVAGGLWTLASYRLE